MATTAELLARIKEKKNQYSRSMGKTVKLKEGKTTIRPLIIPELVSDDHPFGERDLGVHWIKTEKEGKPVAVVGDEEIVYGRPSKLKQVIDQAAKAAMSDEQLAVIKDWSSKKSVLINAIIRTGVDAGEQAQILELTPTTWGQILSIYETYIEQGREDVLDPKTGLDFIVERRGKQKDTEYTVMPAPMSKPVDPKVLKAFSNLDDFIASEFFKGEEKKAISAMLAYSGLPPASGALTGPSTTTALLTSTKPVEEAPFAEAKPIAPAAVAAPAPVVAPPAPVAPAPAPAPVAPPAAIIEPAADDVEAMLADLEASLS